MKSKKRQYQEVWETIKQNVNKTISVTCPNEPGLRKRYRKAIIKEKDIDISWKYKRYYRLTVTEDDKGLHFTLKLYRTAELAGRAL